MASQYDFTVTLHDLAFILKQIKISEAATNPDGSINGDALRESVSSPLLPYGLRTVDGSWNSLLPGQELYGSADQTMPRLTALNWQDADLGTSYFQIGGTVVDADPRTISNLISDQTASNPAAQEVFDALKGVPGGGTITGEGNTLTIPNQSPDVGLSPAFNGWMTFFGQFFDHGLDLIPKGGNGIVFIPLQPDDPLYVEGSQTNFMILTRATVDENRETVNTTTPFIDQNQTYTSHPSHQIFIREYVLIDGKPEPTGNLLGGANGGLATWADVKQQAETLLGITLTDQDVFSVPLLATDRYGNLILSDSGKVQIVTKGGLVEANGGVLPADTFRTGHAFLDDIAHTAAPKAGLVADDDDVIGGEQAPGTYDDELLDRHFITGDGRGNENIGLTAVHAVFHSEHNRLVEQYKTTLLETGDIDLINQWLMPNHQITELPADTSTLVWNGEYLFQAGRFSTEMQYQHLVFEEFARTVQPAVDPFVFSNTADINPLIFAEFAHVVYRFGHSMLTETVARTDIDMQNGDLDLITAFLNPVAFNQINGVGVSDDVAIGAIVRGMTRQVGNEIDEFITDALRNNLIGLPLDLGALNIARGRDTAMPTLNQAREQFFELSGDSQLRPYTSWADFTTYLKNPASIINFMAAYGQHELILNATTLEGKRAAVNFLLFGDKNNAPPADALDFFNSTGAWATKETGLNMVDFWIGGLAERKNEFGGMLGSTFNFVFETQMEMLQDGDLSFQLEQGEVLGIIGPSASGKTSLAKVLVGVWKPLSGKVRLDGADICQWDKELLGPSIGYLPQDVELFDGTIAQNIARFTKNDSELIVAAALLAGVHEMILRLPQGYDTLLGSGGYQLSGGQRQRIGLARAVYNNPVFLVLDEPNANLDDAGEFALIKAINTLRTQGQTTVIISHRPTLLGVVNKVLLLNEGAIQEFGTRDQVFTTLRQANVLKPVATASSSNNEQKREA